MLIPCTLTRAFSSIPPKPLDWLWQPRIPKGKLTILLGDPASGKTSLLLALAAHLSTATPLPTQDSALSTEHSLLPSATLLLNPDDNAADTLRPKLDKLCANLDLIHILPNFPSLIPNPHHSPLAETPLQTLEAAIQSIPNLALLIIDPITHYLGLTDRTLTPDPHSENSPRSILHALAQLAEKYHLALILTSRLTKKTDPTLNPHTLQRALGSLAFASIPRSVLLTVPAPTPNHNPHPQPSPGIAIPGSTSSPTTDPTPSPCHPVTQSPLLPSPTHLLLTLKSTTTFPAPPLPFTLTDTIQFHPELPDLLTPKPEPPKPGPTDILLQAAIHWLHSALAAGPLPAYTLTEDARKNAISPRTLLRAKETAHIESLKQPWSGKWFWKLPHDPRPLPENQMDKQIAMMAKSISEDPDGCGDELGNLLEIPLNPKSDLGNLLQNKPLPAKKLGNLAKLRRNSTP